MKIEVSREDMIQVLLGRIEEMDPEEAREELYEYYAKNIYPQYSDEELAGEFYERVIAYESASEDDEHPPTPH